MKKFEDNKLKLAIIGVIILLIGALIFYLKLDKKENDNEVLSLKEDDQVATLKIDSNYIDIKGSVNNPGVYEFKENDRVIDAIELAGGLTKDANTSNINLSQKLTSEMVIYIYNNNEIKMNAPKLTCDTVCKTEVIEVNNCIEVTKSTTSNENDSKNTNSLVNINTANLSELMTLSGIGEAKAKSIIEYRSTNGKFNTIEDIKNISGIGDALFEKIKDKITV